MRIGQKRYRAERMNGWYQVDFREVGTKRRQTFNLDELVRNGIRFTPDGGSVVVRAIARGHDLAIEVRDTGVGLSDEARLRLLDDVYVPHDSRHHHTASGLEFNVAGMGLGLLLVRRVVDGHGGRLVVDGRRDQGSQFTMLFPGAVAGGAELEQAA